MKILVGTNLHISGTAKANGQILKTGSYVNDQYTDDKSPSKWASSGSRDPCFLKFCPSHIFGIGEARYIKCADCKHA